MLDDAMGTQVYFPRGQFYCLRNCKTKPKIVPRNPRLRIAHEQRNFSGKVQGALNDRYDVMTST